MYAKIIDEKTKQVSVGIGTNSAFYQSIGMTEMEVEQAYNGSWYVQGYAPKKPLELVKAEKLAEIKQAFNQEQEDGHIVSSLGFEVDATRRSKDDIESLLYVDEFPVRFRDYNNEFHNLEKEQVEVLKREIIAYGLAVYQKKWSLEEAIKNATTIEEVEAVVW
ncbi:MAG: DUF4376 domain-containing protein [Alphaproteobacteria bacterium]|nr:DUF4376 domain-containing protein [Alphaproteobacteria bacterium]